MQVQITAVDAGYDFIVDLSFSQLGSNVCPPLRGASQVDDVGVHAESPSCLIIHEDASRSLRYPKRTRSIRWRRPRGSSCLSMAALGNLTIHIQSRSRHRPPCELARPPYSLFAKLISARP